MVLAFPFLKWVRIHSRPLLMIFFKNEMNKFDLNRKQFISVSLVSMPISCLKKDLRLFELNINVEQNLLVLTVSPEQICSVETYDKLLKILCFQCKSDIVNLWNWPNNENKWRHLWIRYSLSLAFPMPNCKVRLNTKEIYLIK